VLLAATSMNCPRRIRSKKQNKPIRSNHYCVHRSIGHDDLQITEQSSITQHTKGLSPYEFVVSKNVCVLRSIYLCSWGGGKNKGYQYHWTLSAINHSAYIQNAYEFSYKVLVSVHIMGRFLCN
jgi:hypothetical protein